MKPVFIIAELGINHNGDLSLCKEMISAARACGADAAKLQINNPRRISADAWLIGVQEKTRLSVAQMREAREHAAREGIELFSSAGDVTALADFVAVGFPRIKISSSNLLNAILHERVAAMGLPVLVSTGDADLDSVRRVTQLYVAGGCDVTLMHCIPKYPTPKAECALASIPYLRAHCGVPVGYSDHTEGDEACVLAVAMGAVALEKHFTLDRTAEGPDHHFSADPEQFRRLVARVREAEAMGGEPQQVYSPAHARDSSRVRRAIVFDRPKRAGEVISVDDILIARPARHVPGEINPLDYRECIGAILTRDIQAFEALTRDGVRRSKAG